MQNYKYSYQNAKWMADKSPDGTIVFKDKENISVEIDGVPCTVPTDNGNIHYEQIMRKVAEGTLTIADAD
jgi:hypothetical protein